MHGNKQNYHFFHRWDKLDLRYLYGGNKNLVRFQKLNSFFASSTEKEQFFFVRFFQGGSKKKVCFLHRGNKYFVRFHVMVLQKKLNIFELNIIRCGIPGDTDDYSSHFGDGGVVGVTSKVVVVVRS